MASPVPHRTAVLSGEESEESGLKECEGGSVGVWQPAKVNPSRKASGAGARMNSHPAQGRVPMLRS